MGLTIVLALLTSALALAGTRPLARAVLIGRPADLLDQLTLRRVALGVGLILIVLALAAATDLGPALSATGDLNLWIGVFAGLSLLTATCVSNPSFGQLIT